MKKLTKEKLIAVDTPQDQVPKSIKEIQVENKRDALVDKWRTDNAIAEVQCTDAVYKDELYEVSVNVETSPEQRKILEEIRRIVTEGINSDQEDKSPMEEYADAIAERRMIAELQQRLKDIAEQEESKIWEGPFHGSEGYKQMIGYIDKLGYTATPTELHIGLTDSEGKTTIHKVPQEVYNHDSHYPNNSNSKNNYTSLEQIYKDLSSLAVGYEAADWKEDMLRKLKASINQGMFIQINGTI